MNLTESQLRKKIRHIISEILGARSKKGGTQLQRALGYDEETFDNYGGGGGGGGHYDYDDDDAAYDIGVALDTDDDGLDD